MGGGVAVGTAACGRFRSRSREDFDRVRTLRIVTRTARRLGVRAVGHERTIIVHELDDGGERMRLPVACGARTDDAAFVDVVVTARAVLFQPQIAMFTVREERDVRMGMALLARELEVTSREREVQASVVVGIGSVDAGEGEAPRARRQVAQTAVLGMARRALVARVLR